MPCVALLPVNSALLNVRVPALTNAPPPLPVVALLYDTTASALSNFNVPALEKMPPPTLALLPFVLPPIVPPLIVVEPLAW